VQLAKEQLSSQYCFGDGSSFNTRPKTANYKAECFSDESAWLTASGVLPEKVQSYVIGGWKRLKHG